MWMVPPEGIRRWKVAVTCSVRRATVSWMRLEAAAVPPSTARNALVIATEILLISNGTTVPLRLITRICPGAVAAMLALTLVFSWAGVAAALPDVLVSVCIFAPLYWRDALLL